MADDQLSGGEIPTSGNIFLTVFAQLGEIKALLLGQAGDLREIKAKQLKDDVRLGALERDVASIKAKADRDDVRDSQSGMSGQTKALWAAVFVAFATAVTSDLIVLIHHS